jgi:5'-methylthioadenosine phosphorylase
VLRVFAENVGTMRDLLLHAVAELPPADSDCTCRHSLDGQKLPFDLP